MRNNTNTDKLELEKDEDCFYIVSIIQKYNPWIELQRACLFF